MEKIQIDINEVAPVVEAVVAPVAETVAPVVEAVVAPMIISPEILATIPTVETVDENPFAAYANPTPVGEEVHEQVKKELEEYDDITGTEIASVKPVFYSGLIKFLETLSPGLGSEDVISIKDGKLVISKSGGIISCDLTNIFGKNDWNIKDPNKTLKVLKLIGNGDKVTILDAGNKYIVYSSNSLGPKTITDITKPDNNNFIQVKEIDPGELKTSTDISNDIISNLIAAKNVAGGIYYNITLDADTYELLSLDVNDKFKDIIKSEVGRQTVRYKVKELFPVSSKVEQFTFEVYNKDGQIYIKTLSNVAMVNVYHQSAAISNPKRADLNFDQMM